MPSYSILQSGPSPLEGLLKGYCHRLFLTPNIFSPFLCVLFLPPLSPLVLFSQFAIVQLLLRSNWVTQYLSIERVTLLFWFGIAPQDGAGGFFVCSFCMCVCCVFVYVCVCLCVFVCAMAAVGKVKFSITMKSRFSNSLN